MASLRRLLIISCSKSKNSYLGPLPAWERYQGGCFPTLKQIQIQHGIPPDIDILIISAKYGLLNPKDPIEWYDLKMTIQRAKFLQPKVRSKIVPLLKAVEYSQSLVFLEEVYGLCLKGVSLPQPMIYLKSLTEENLMILKYWVISENCAEST